MMLRRINTAAPAARLRGELDRLFTDFCDDLGWSGLPGLAGTRAFPALNIWEDEHHIYAEAEVPGMTMDQLEVLVMGNELTIKGERTCACDANMTYHRRERGQGSFSRVLHLPVEIAAEDVSAKLADGVLQITMPKAEKARPRKIEVQVTGD